MLALWTSSLGPPGWRASSGSGLKALGDQMGTVVACGPHSLCHDCQLDCCVEVARDHACVKGGDAANRMSLKRRGGGWPNLAAGRSLLPLPWVSARNRICAPGSTLLPLGGLLSPHWDLGGIWGRQIRTWCLESQGQRSEGAVNARFVFPVGTSLWQLQAAWRTCSEGGPRAWIWPAA